MGRLGDARAAAAEAEAPDDAGAKTGARDESVLEVIEVALELQSDLGARRRVCEGLEIQKSIAASQ